jgi:nitroreductase/NAD-dependent dihydropyrimidine dehydrogenase PreA subunit
MNMSLFTIDQNKCRRDGICVQECPGQIIVQTAKDDFPSPADNADEFCIDCGHCVAVCPHGAISLKSMTFNECPPVQKDLHPGPEQIRQFLTARRSVRKYTDASVAHGLLERLLDTARYAPTGSNKQQVHWIVFENRVDVRKLASLVIDWIRLTLPETQDEYLSIRMKRIISAWDQGKDRILRDAPHLVVVHSPADLPFAGVDCTIALTYLELYAYALGLGTCWAGYFTSAANFYAPLSKALQLPEGHVCFGAVMLGYPQYKYKRIPLRHKPLVSWRS